MERPGTFVEARMSRICENQESNFYPLLGWGEGSTRREACEGFWSTNTSALAGAGLLGQLLYLQFSECSLAGPVLRRRRPQSPDF